MSKCGGVSSSILYTYLNAAVSRVYIYIYTYVCVYRALTEKVRSPQLRPGDCSSEEEEEEDFPAIEGKEAVS